jgi:hypothetical protein
VTIRELHRVLAGIGITPSPDEVADALWLATLATPSASLPVPFPSATPPAIPNEPDRGGAAVPLRAADRLKDTRHQGKAGADGPDRLHLRLPGKPVVAVDRAPVPIAVGTALSSLALSRALRPLRHNRVVGDGTILDEEATADLGAEQGLLMPILKLTSSPALDLALVVDASESMELWDGHVREFRALCEQLGAFRDIRTWHLVSTRESGLRGAALRGASPAAGLRRPQELLEPSGRRLILMITDGVHPGWLPSGPFRALLTQWNSVNPVAIVQPSPQRLWDRSALRPALAEFRATGPSRTSARIIRLPDGQPDDFRPAQGRNVAIPILELVPNVLARWARMVCGSSAVTPLAAALLGGAADGGRPAEAGGFAADPSGADPVDPATLVRAFRASVSAEAYRLAGYLSIVAPLNLPVMRLVLESAMPDAGSAELAEVFLGGLMRRVPGSTGDSARGTVGPVGYGFAAGVRDVLQATVTRGEAVTLLDVVGTYLVHGKRGGRPFTAIVENPDGGDVAAAAEQYPPFARVTSKVFERLGGPFAEAARRLVPAPPVDTTSDDDLAADSPPIDANRTVIVNQPPGLLSDGGQGPAARRDQESSRARHVTEAKVPSSPRASTALRFRRVTGEQIDATDTARFDRVEFPAAEFLTARKVRLDDGTELVQHRPTSGAHRLDGYDRLDNEILAGRRLWEAVSWGDYPPEVARLYGDESMSADPFSLFTPYRGIPLREVGSYLLGDELEHFRVSLLTGLRWLADAGIAHNAINLDTVLWDPGTRTVQITDFSRSKVFGAPREPIDGSAAWVPREQRRETTYGYTSVQDDVWAAGRLIFYVQSRGEDLADRRQLTEHGLDGLLANVFSPPEDRPTAREMLARLNTGAWLPHESRARIEETRRPFFAARARKFPGLSSAEQTLPQQADPAWRRPPAVAPESRPGTVFCPLCLEEIRDWDELTLWRYDQTYNAYVELRVPAELSSAQRAQRMVGAYVRCPNTTAVTTEHYLPVNYGRFGAPVVLGLVGSPDSGKTHLAAAMVHAIEVGLLEQYGLQSRPMDASLHRRFLDGWVNPLFDHGTELPKGPNFQMDFLDAFLIKSGDGPEQPVVFFDAPIGGLVPPNELPNIFWVADGLFFMVDADHMTSSQAGDAAFANALHVVQEGDRSAAVSAAIILAKADKMKLDEPAARWLRADGRPLNAAEVLAESADVYAYLSGNHASLTAPYQACGRATLHVTSATGGPPDGAGTFSRGVAPRGVLRPLLAMLAMTGILPGQEAERIGF